MEKAKAGVPAQKSRGGAFQENIKTAKKAARAKARLLLKGLSAAEREAQSQKAAALFLNSSIYKSSECVAAFFSLPDEVDVFPIIARAFIDKKRVLLPRIVAGSNAMDFYELAAPLGLASDSVAAPVLGVEAVSDNAAPVLGVESVSDNAAPVLGVESVPPRVSVLQRLKARGLDESPKSGGLIFGSPGLSDDFALASALGSQTDVNAWGIREPLPTLPLVSKDKIPARTAILVPGLAFCNDGRRLGRGKGFYDRYLSELLAANPAFAERGKICGYCMVVQVADTVPTEENDVRVQALFC